MSEAARKHDRRFCLDCKERQLGCHGRCEAYKAFQAARQAALERAKADRVVSRAASERFTSYRRST